MVVYPSSYHLLSAFFFLLNGTKTTRFNLKFLSLYFLFIIYPPYKCSICKLNNTFIEPHRGGLVNSSRNYHVSPGQRWTFL